MHRRVFMIRRFATSVAAVIVVAVALFSPCPAAAADQEYLIRLVEMPVAVARVAEIHALDNQRFRDFLAALSRGDIHPAEYADLVRHAPVALSSEVSPDEEIASFISAKIDAGLRSEALANAIRDEWRVRGIAIDRRMTMVHLPDATESDFLPESVVQLAPSDVRSPSVPAPSAGEGGSEPDRVRAGRPR